MAKLERDRSLAERIYRNAAESPQTGAGGAGSNGTGVFARDPDALLDMVELDLTEDIVKQQKNQAACRLCESALKQYAPDVLADTPGIYIRIEVLP